MLKVGLRTVDSHEVEEAGTLLNSGATGLFINCAWLHQKQITTRKLEGIRVLTFAQAMGSHDQNQIRISAKEITSICLITKRAGGSR